jgi:hypothetical protein
MCKEKRVLQKKPFYLRISNLLEEFKSKYIKEKDVLLLLELPITKNL